MKGGTKLPKSNRNYLDGRTVAELQAQAAQRRRPASFAGRDWNRPRMGAWSSEQHAEHSQPTER